MNKAEAKNADYTEYSDAELIEIFRKAGDDRAFEALVHRHYRSIQRRFSFKTGNDADADDLTQQLWIRVVENIDNYDDSGRFPHYVSTIATNMLTDYWRKKGFRGQYDAQWPEDDDAVDRINVAQKTAADNEQQSRREEAIRQLVTKFIPELPVEQRTIYLLRHESEHWEDKAPMSWQHLAQLCGMDLDMAWSRFDSARRGLLDTGRDSLKDTEDACVFFVWTQAQRPGKHYTFEDKDFSQMLDIPVSTLKSRYRAAVKQLAEKLKSLDS